MLHNGARERKKERAKKNPHKVLSDDDDVAYLLTSEPSARGYDFKVQGPQEFTGSTQSRDQFHLSPLPLCESWAPQTAAVILTLQITCTRLFGCCPTGGHLTLVTSDWWLSTPVSGDQPIILPSAACVMFLKSQQQGKVLNIIAHYIANIDGLCKHMFEKREKERELTDQRQYRTIK